MDEQDIAARRKRSIVLALALGALAVLVFLMSLVKWAEHAFPQ